LNTPPVTPHPVTPHPVTPHPVTPQFYGRRRGRVRRGERVSPELHASPSWTLSGKELAQLRALQECFSPTCRELWMEVGFGYGENTQGLLDAHPHVGCLGFEPFVTGVSAFLKRISKDPAAYQGRLRVIGEDVRPFLPTLPAQQFHRIYVLFSDPWPKKRHHKRRLLNEDFLTQCARLLVTGGKLVLAHDHRSYLEEVLTLLAHHPCFRWTTGARTGEEDLPWPQDWPLTRYGAKALAKGASLGFSVWETTS